MRKVTTITSEEDDPNHQSLITQLGGRAMLDFLAAASSSDWLAIDPDLTSVYGELRRRKLVALEKKLLLFAFADEEGEEECQDGIFLVIAFLVQMTKPLFVQLTFYDFSSTVYETPILESLQLRFLIVYQSVL
eukprot:scaffold2533_cov137-Cylindrotheca_fusiformis.AAC.18